MDGGSSRESQQRKLSVSGNCENASDNHQKKTMHRDMEKQRRREMSVLHASLRSLLPLEHIKGKRSISDHINGAVNYINDLKKRITELSAKRDKLKKSDLSVSSPGGSGSTNDRLPCCSVMVHPCLSGGLEVVISYSSFKEPSLPLSRVLEVLLKEGLDVVNCVSTKVNDEMLLLTLQTQARDDPTFVDVSGLQQKLLEVMTASS
ncbi:hypothetical protein Pint_17330 [Pistacia integerrima]|uniref:Uncharacterized protein n=1 Tax=Pistacia integerrima TaxID=434235 RepID=A0ACC0YYB9_9ROSI|nr:hypothetical protein Pint_17330 [Pistacia integerrima]